jgi:formamidopyrimidine-DNA glycosylase
MPELPDVEIFRRYLNAKALNEKIARVVVKNTTVTRNTSPQTIARHLKGRKLQSSHRHGKFLFGVLDQGGSVVFHFGMTGFFKYFKEKTVEPKHTRVRFEFSNHAFLGFVCPRMFGQVDYANDVNQYIKKRRLGPDALAGHMARIQRAVSGQTKLDQVSPYESKVASRDRKYLFGRDPFSRARPSSSEGRPVE